MDIWWLFGRFSLVEGACQEVEEGWRRVGGGLRRIEEGWRRTGGAQLGLDRSKCYQNEARIGGSQNRCKSRKTVFYVFVAFYPLISSFQAL